MKLKELKKEIKGVFKQPKRKYYFGKIKFGTPYFLPINYLSSIIYIKKLKLKPQVDKIDKKNSNYLKNYYKLPLVRRNKFWIIKDWYIEIGFPIYFIWSRLGWKDKYESPRFEWCPSFQIYFFGLQFCIWWVSPMKENEQYYEQILWYLYYSDKDIIKAEKTWGWKTAGKSTWNNDYLIN